MAHGTCIVPSCSNPYRSRGYCNKHYERLRLKGLLSKRVQPTTEQRFWARVEQAGSCWLWQASRTRGGYGKFSKGSGGWLFAHRWAYESLIAPIPDGLVIDHLCCVRACVNPWHLEPVPRGVNTIRAMTKGVLRPGARYRQAHAHPLCLAVTTKGTICVRDRDHDGRHFSHGALRQRRADLLSDCA